MFKVSRTKGQPRRNSEKNAVGLESMCNFLRISTQDHPSLADRKQVLRRVMPRLLHAMLLRLFLRVKMGGLGKKIPLAPRRVIRYFGQRVIWGKGSGRGGATTTDGAWWKPRCIASSCLVKCVMARDFDRQVAELQVRAALLNRFTHLGTPVTVRVA